MVNSEGRTFKVNCCKFGPQIVETKTCEKSLEKDPKLM